MSKKRPSLSRGSSPGLTERPSNAMVSVEGDNTMAALTSPKRRTSLKKTFTRDSSTPMIDATATARRSQPAHLLQALSTGDAAQSRRDSSEFTAASPARSALTGSEVDMEVWVADEQKVWVQGRVTEQVGRSELLVLTHDGAKVKIDMAATPELYTVNPTLEDDMTSLWHLHEPGILHNLHGRFLADQPYTFVAHLLVAVNPLKPTPNPAMEVHPEPEPSPSLSPNLGPEPAPEPHCVISPEHWRGQEPDWPGAAPVRHRRERLPRAAAAAGGAAEPVDRCLGRERRRQDRERQDTHALHHLALGRRRRAGGRRLDAQRSHRAVQPDARGARLT